MRTHRQISLLIALACSSATILGVAGCSDEPTTQAPDRVGGSTLSSVGASIARPRPADPYSVRLDEIKLLAQEGDVEQAAQATNSLLADVSSDVASGTTSADEGLAVAEGAQQAVIGIDIDVHFGTNEKCDAQFNCTKAQQMCVTVTWHLDGNGGRNCYNWGGQAN